METNFFMLYGKKNTGIYRVKSEQSNLHKIYQYLLPIPSTEDLNNFLIEHQSLLSADILLLIDHWNGDVTNHTWNVFFFMGAFFKIIWENIINNLYLYYYFVFVNIPVYKTILCSVNTMLVYKIIS